MVIRMLKYVLEENVKMFKERLSDVNWSNSCSSEDANISYRQFMILMHLFIQYFFMVLKSGPLKRMT